MKISYFYFLCLLLFLFQGCLNNEEDLTQNNEPPPTNVSFSNDIQTIFTSSCAGGCHINSTTNGVNLSSYDAIMNSVGTLYNGPVVIPDDPDNSPLVDKIEPNPEIGNRMPQGGPYLTNQEISKIRAWIENGAENN